MKKLYKSKDNKVFSGVMGGIGEYFGVDPILIRAGYVFLSIITGVFPGILAYILLVFVIPEKPKPGERVRVSPIEEEEKTEEGQN
ncbi:MAG: hypothetical protein COU07_01200 [Candidatus Harrisonbacteria bacterium CG10_big_fil_rev_8_21_14_0_10_40_38]|uniref:Phage shock protein PspC N-terminal domain-containing protein n=1 Tax=Candidatus Harrisonbacteria bacterium CG10_big_fil_rev_8_21_14_0_10_40_38 TaxID=1974583 RepID=A0A2H0USV1_9BACT|nr:MAG: hypothetical protein COU07_01200 [Candidatus Harrisonbacteria bacterium CG10_big_fil_rev_8_21_14_0_10_40_38]